MILPREERKLGEVSSNFVRCTLKKEGLSEKKKGKKKFFFLPPPFSRITRAYIREVVRFDQGEIPKSWVRTRVCVSERILELNLHPIFHALMEPWYVYLWAREFFPLY